MLPYGNVHKDRAARIERAKRKQDWAWKGSAKADLLHPIDRDSKNRRPVVTQKYAPEVLQAAQALGVSPAAVLAEARKVRAIVKLAAKYSR